MTSHHYKKRRVKNAKKLETSLFLKSEYNLLYSSEYIEKFKTQFHQYIHNNKDKIVDYIQIERDYNPFLIVILERSYVNLCFQNY